MKKGLKIVLLTSVLALAGVSTTAACLSASINQPAITVYAEEEFEQKAYTLTDGETVLTLTLLTETECSLRRQILAEGKDETIMATYVRDGNIVTITYNEEQIVIEVNDETMTFGEYIPPVVGDEENVFEELWSKFEAWKETYLVPLLSGVSITTIVTLLINVILTIVREKRATKRENTASEEHEHAEALIAQAYAVIALVKDVFEHIKTQVLQNDALKQLIENKLNELEKLLNKNSREITKINKIEPILKILVQIQGKLALVNENAIASGITADINELIRLAKEF